MQLSSDSAHLEMVLGPTGEGLSPARLPPRPPLEKPVPSAGYLKSYRISESDLLRKQGFCRWIEMEGSDEVILGYGGPKSNDRRPHKTEKRRERHTEEK